MISLFFFVLALIIAAILLGVFRKTNYYSENNRFKASGIVRLVAAFFIALVVGLISPVNMERIDAGHVGIKVSNVGDNRGVGKTEYVTGWVFYNS